MRWLYHMNGPADAATFQWNICSINRSCPDWKSDTQTHTHSKRFFIVNKVEENRKKRNVYWLLWFLILNKTPLLKAIMKTAVYVEFCSLGGDIYKITIFINWSHSYLGHACNQPTLPPTTRSFCERQQWHCAEVWRLAPALLPTP